MPILGIHIPEKLDPSPRYQIQGLLSMSHCRPSGSVQLREGIFSSCRRFSSEQGKEVTAPELD